ncbi:hypothetical protein TRFO_28105 [Tritrichomonas foetus]|uniref:Uncharacterized protein n=1 Tax=Tritrichomonas foetus TaxID=1144522 RepID=A0A1J4JYV9_9EUKA|nr:hypothetical protein TRFO_28105 [Tritrichomonas foetus]|eukprot:OHT04351.1 hypothetical protein TRFO_28105 [Tritrichomonas foetus]
MDTSELESLIPDNIQDGEQRAEMEERIYIIMQIKDKLKTISKLKQNLRNAKLKEIVHDTEIAEINCTKNSLKIKVNELQERLAKANQRFDVASKKKANPYDPVHFEEGIIEKIEQSADDSEKRLNRSRVDAIEYELQHEFSSYQALKDENKKRTEALQAKRLEIQKMKQRQQQRSKIISKMTPRKRDDHTETQIRSPASSVMTPEKRSNLNQKKQSALDKFNQEVDELEKANKEARLKTEKEYYEVMAHLQTLTRESHKNDETFVKMCNLSTQVDKLRLEESEVAQQLAKLTNSRAILTHKLKTMKGKEQYADKVAELDAIKLTIQAKEKDLSLMREKVAQQRAAVEGLQSNVDDYESRRNEIEKQIAELNKHITDSVETIVDYSQYMNSIHLAVFNQPGKEEEEEQVIEEKQNEEEEEEAQLNEEEEEAQLDNESNPNEFMEEENKTESVNEDIQEEDNLPEEENVHELEEENVPEVEEELQENIPIAEEEKMIDGNENVIDGEQQFNDEEENKASKIKL